ncbi:MAG: glycosyltransferase family 9 protein [Fibrobacterota bacterium]
MNLLIIRFSSMGDVVLVSSVIAWLYQNHPDINLNLLTLEQYAPLFQDDPRLCKIIAVSKGREQCGVRKYGHMRWGGVIDLQNNGRSKRLCRSFFRGVPCIRLNKHRFARALLLTARVNLYPENNSVACRYIHAARKLLSSIHPDIAVCRSGQKTDLSGSALPSLKLFFTRSVCERKLEIACHDRPILSLFPFAAWKNKQWPIERYAAVGRYFRDKGWNIIVMGGAQDQAQSSRLCSIIGERCMDLTGRTSLYEAGGVLQKVSMALGNDTGLSHLARACGVPGGVIFGSTTHHLGFFPYGTPNFVIFEKKLSCRPCHAHGGNSCRRGKRVCLEGISSEKVIAGLERLHDLSLKEGQNNSFFIETNIKRDRIS